MCDGNCKPEEADAGRREFLTRASLAAVSGLLLNSCGALVNLFTPGTAQISGGPLTINVADYPALATVGGTALLRNVPAPMAAVRTSTASFLVFSRTCPHQGTTIGLSGSGFRCPNHGAQFDSTGKNTGGFRTGPLGRYTTAYDPATDTLTIS